MGVAQPTRPQAVERVIVSTEPIAQSIVNIASNLFRRRPATLAVLVAAEIQTERPNLARIGREIAGSITAKSAANRAWQLTSNERSRVAEAMAGVISHLVRNRKRRFLVSVGCTETRHFHTLTVVACVVGRAVPLSGFRFPERKLLRSQNSLEISLLRHLRSLTAGSVPVAAVA
jgi:hypothetical protein